MAEMHSDEDLLRRITGGDSAAFESFVRRHSAGVQRLAAAITREASAAEDVTQQTFLAVFRSASSFAGRASARSWLLTIARNEACRVIARAPRETALQEPLMSLGQDAGWGAPDPEKTLEAARARQLLTQALEQLNLEDREVLLLRDVEQLTGPEAADALGISLRALKSRLHRARLRLAAHYRKLTERALAPRTKSTNSATPTERKQGKSHARTI